MFCAFSPSLYTSRVGYFWISKLNMQSLFINHYPVHALQWDLYVQLKDYAAMLLRLPCMSGHAHFYKESHKYSIFQFTKHVFLSPVLAFLYVWYPSHTWNYPLSTISTDNQTIHVLRESCCQNCPKDHLLFRSCLACVIYPLILYTLILWCFPVFLTKLSTSTVI